MRHELGFPSPKPQLAYLNAGVEDATKRGHHGDRTRTVFEDPFGNGHSAHDVTKAPARVSCGSWGSKD